MKSLKIIFAAVIIILVSSYLVGCNLPGVSSEGAARIQEAQSLKKTVSMKLVEVPESDNVKLQLVLENPEKEPITSFQAWLTYNPDHLEGVAIHTDESPFELMAPYENDFDDAMGLIMVGRSTKSPITDEEIVALELELNKLSEGVTMIEAYDYKQDLTGHTSVNKVENEAAFNVLLKPDSPLISIN